MSNFYLSQKHCIEEARELKDRIDGLEKHLDTHMHADRIFNRQLDAMRAYHSVLNERIGRFTVENATNES